MMAGGFQAIDLDAVLDEFESKEESTTVAAAKTSPLESPTSDEKNSSSSKEEFFDVPESPRDIVQAAEAAGLHHQNQPDVLSPVLKSSSLSGPDEILAAVSGQDDAAVSGQDDEGMKLQFCINFQVSCQVQKHF